MNERQLMCNLGVYCWTGGKMRRTLIGTKLGVIVLTNRRLIFLSTGGNDVAILAAAGAAGIPIPPSQTDHLDLDALGNEGSLDIPLHTIVEYGWRRRTFSNFLWVKHSDPIAGNQAWAFAGQLVFPDGPKWEEAIGAAKESAAAG